MLGRPLPNRVVKVFSGIRLPYIENLNDFDFVNPRFNEEAYIYRVIRSLADHPVAADSRPQQFSERCNVSFANRPVKALHQVTRIETTDLEWRTAGKETGVAILQSS